MEIPAAKITRIASLKTAAEFRAFTQGLGLNIPCDDRIELAASSPLAQPVTQVTINGKTIGNRFAIQPMEGWDGTTTGGISEEMVRRWSRFGESGAKLIYGGEAMAIRGDGRANPHQLIINEENQKGIATLRDTLLAAHREKYGNTDDLVIGFQLTHSGRFCRPHHKSVWESRVAYRHPILDRKFNVVSDEQVLADDEVEELISTYVRAAKIAREIGADFVDVKHCHGYLLHEFLSARGRAGKYGGSFANRTRPLREIVAGIRASGNEIDIGVRLSAFDSVPFKPDPASSRPGKLGPGIPEEVTLPYTFAFGTNAANPLAYDLAETAEFVALCGELGVKILNFSAGSPYYNPHIQRPASFPPSDGYQSPNDPIIDVARQFAAVKHLKAGAPADLVIVGSGYSYLQEYLPQVAQALVREGWTDMIGMGRMALSYPTMLADGIAHGTLTPKLICRTFSDCTTAPRNGMVSGCYPLDKYYADRPEAQALKQIKKTMGGTALPVT